MHVFLANTGKTQVSAFYILVYGRIEFLYMEKQAFVCVAYICGNTELLCLTMFTC